MLSMRESPVRLTVRRRAIMVFESYRDSQDQKKVIKCASLPPREINGVVVSVDEGTGVIRAYEAMVYGVKQNDPAVQEKWKRLLLQYCRLDSLSMYMVWAHWRGQVF